MVSLSLSRLHLLSLSSPSPFSLSLLSLSPLSLSPLSLSLLSLSLLSWSAREQSGEAQGEQASESVCLYLSVCVRARVRDARVQSVASAS
jgi:hypothetical protein